MGTFIESDDSETFNDVRTLFGAGERTESYEDLCRILLEYLHGSYSFQVFKDKVNPFQGKKIVFSVCLEKEIEQNLAMYCELIKDNLLSI